MVFVIMCCWGRVRYDIDKWVDFFKGNGFVIFVIGLYGYGVEMCWVRVSLLVIVSVVWVGSILVICCFWELFFVFFMIFISFFCFLCFFLILVVVILFYYFFSYGYLCYWVEYNCDWGFFFYVSDNIVRYLYLWVFLVLFLMWYWYWWCFDCIGGGMLWFFGDFYRFVIS